MILGVTGHRPHKLGVYRELLARAVRVEMVCPGGYGAEKLQIRNEWIVDHVDAMLAVWDGTRGGTGNCVRYAQRAGKPIERIDPLSGACVKLD